MRSARVFISCGQRNEHERRIGLAVEAQLRAQGFDTFFAEAAHSPEGLTEHIFRFLAESEYFVFIDFRRETLGDDSYRGSLFVNQELAVATYLRIPGVGFVERGVRREGMANYHIHNAIEFEDDSEILANLAEETGAWDPSSVRELALRYDPAATTRGIMLSNWQQGPRVSDWYHLEVLNRHHERHAFSCMGYLTRIVDGEGRDVFQLPSVELMWAAIKDVRANVMARTARDLDAFYVVEGHPEVLFHHRAMGTSNPRYHLPRLSAGAYRLEYSVVSANFPTVSAWYELEFDGSRANATFGPANA